MSTNQTKQSMDNNTLRAAMLDHSSSSKQTNKLLGLTTQIDALADGMLGTTTDDNGFLCAAEDDSSF